MLSGHVPGEEEAPPFVLVMLQGERERSCAELADASPREAPWGSGNSGTPQDGHVHRRPG